MSAGSSSSLLRGFVILTLTFLLSLAGNSAYGSGTQDREYLRAKVLALVLRHDLSMLHFNHKKIDDTLSKEAFSQYLKNLDSQKLLLLKEDVKKLSKYSDMIDDEINGGTFELPSLAADILSRRAAYAQKMAVEILAKDFDFSVKEYYEADSKKVDYCDTDKDLRERWRKYLKLQVLQQYLTLKEDPALNNKDKKIGPGSEPLQQTARQRVLRGQEAFLSRIRQQNMRDNLDRFFNTVARTFDPHTEYMPPATKEDFDIGMRGTLEGIGAALREEDGYIKITSVVPGSPAARQGRLHAEDIILKVGEKDKDLVDITYMGIREAIKLIRGKKGTRVWLQLKKPDGGQIVVSIVRDVIKLEDSFVKGSTLRDKKSGLTFGYIKIPSFYRDFEKTTNGGGRNSTNDVLKELKKPEMQKISGLILDLRNNGGGALTDAVKTAGLFIRTGPVVQVKGSDGKISVLSDDDPDIAYTGPIIVLVNKFSASASEILAGALQDYGRAIIMGGEHTHGKGTVQTLIDLNNFFAYSDAGGDLNKDESLGALKLTTQKFYRITGESTQYRGISPDIVLPDRYQGLKTGEQFLDFALPWDTVQPVSYSKWKNSGVIDFRRLRAIIDKRVSAEKDFVEIVEENKELIAKQKKTLRPLDLEEAVKERKILSELTEKHNTKSAKYKTEKDHSQDTSELSEEGRQKLWLKEVGEDPYILEGMAVLTDVITRDSSISLN